MKRVIKIAVWTLSILVLVSLAFALYVSYVLKTFNLRLPPLSAAEKTIADEVGTLDQGMRDGTIAWRKADYTSVGFPDQEAKLLHLRSGIDFFTGSFGHAPSDIKDLARLSTVPGLSSNQKRLYGSLVRDCQILTMQTDSYILNCDGWSPPSSLQIEQWTRTVDRETEKFFVMQGHVILFVPPPVSGKPLVLPSH